MKIALNLESVGARRGGAEKYAATLARLLDAAGHEVHVFARAVDAAELPAAVRVHRLPSGRVPGLAWLRSYFFARDSERALREESPELILGMAKVWHQHVCLAVGGAQPATLEYSSRRFRNAWVRRWWWLTKAVNPKQWVFRRIARRQFQGRYASHVIAPSRMVAEHFRRFHDVPAERISVVYNGFDAADGLPDPRQARDDFRRRLGLDDRHVAILFAAHNYPIKGLGPLLCAFAPVARDNPWARLIVCGSRRDGAFRRQAQRLDIADRVLFLGFVDDPRTCFAAADLFAYPTFYDPCSLVVLEAMAAGLPVITTAQNGAGELLTEGAGGFVIESPWALDQWSQRLTLLVRDAALRRRMGQQARAAAGGMSMEVRLRELLAVLDRVARQTHVGRIGNPSSKEAEPLDGLAIRPTGPPTSILSPSPRRVA
jgi:UDP-glucose:(heptosyl)LPS alpha-1,3-glucosyltransferase